MQSFSAQASATHPASHPAEPPHSTDIRATLIGLANEVCATAARLFAYVGVLVLFGILGLHGWNQLQLDLATEPPPEVSWNVADRSFPAFALSPQDISDKSEKSDAYVILRHSLGGRKDIFRWSGTGERPAAELEIYRPGAEQGPTYEASAELAARMLAPDAELESAGVLETQFGRVALLRPASARESAASCLGFLKRTDEPALQISGWSCQGDSLPARRAAIDCMLSRLMLLTAGNEPKLAAYFAHAELKRGGCTSATASADWLTDAASPRLRGTF